MTTLATLLRSVRPADPATDAQLLARHRGGDAEAFAELLRRHGRLVWAACRHQTRTEADADDAFQAVWLVLFRNPAAVRDPAKLSAYLHSVAVRVCGKLRTGNQRRSTREKAVAVADGSQQVPDSAWDRALAAVHEEVARLPEPLRVAFVRCGLEGQGVSEAAEQLGWKLGTLSGRLTRAKGVLAERLASRDLAIGAVVATVCGGAVPAAVVGRTAELTAGAVPASILTLTNGVIGMNRVKLLAATLIVAGGLGAGLGGGLAPVGAQDKPAPATGKLLQWAESDTMKAQPSQWDHKLVAHEPGYAPTANEFQAELRAQEASGGWLFVGQITTTQKGGPVPTLVFRRPKTPPAANTAASYLHRMYMNEALSAADDPNATLFRYLDVVHANPQPKSREQRIAELEQELARLKAVKVPEQVAVRFSQKDLPIGGAELKDVFTRLAAKWYGDGVLTFNVTDAEGGALVVIGEKSQVEWVRTVIKSMSAAQPPAK